MLLQHVITLMFYLCSCNATLHIQVVSVTYSTSLTLSDQLHTVILQVCVNSPPPSPLLAATIH